MVWTGTGTNATNRATLGVLANDNSQRKLIVVDTTITWAAETNPVAPLFYVPIGFKPCFYFYQSEALSSSAGVGLAADLGDAGDPDRIAAALDLDAAGSALSIRLATAVGVPYVYTARTLINLTVTGVPLVSTKTYIMLAGSVAF